MKKLLLVLFALVFSAGLIAQETVPFVNAPSQAAAATVTYNVTVTGGYTLGTIDWDGFASTINAGSYGSELTLAISGPLGATTFALGSGTTYAPGANFVGNSAFFDNAGDPAGTWVFDFYESYDDGGDGLPDANWDNIDFDFNAYAAPGGVTAPWTEVFGATLPAEWTNSSSTGELWVFSTTSIGHSAPNDHTTGSGYFAAVDDSESPHSTDVTLTTPMIDVSALTTPYLDFWVYSDDEASTYGNMTIHVNVWDGAAWNNDYATFTGQTVGWENKTVNLGSLTITGTDIQIQFVGDETSTGTGWYDDIAIDDVTVAEAPIIPIISVTPNPHNYNLVQVGNTASQTFSVTNIGGGVGSITGASIAGDAEFSIFSTTGIPGSLPPDVVQVVVDFTPLAIGTYTATLTITDALGTTDVLLSGEGVAAIPNDDCANAIVVGPTYPETVLGTTKGAVVDCPGVLDWGAVWYEVTLPYALNDLSASYCGTATPPMYTGGIVYLPDCASCASYVIADAYAFDPCTAPDDATLQMNWAGIVGPGTIMFPAYAADASDLGVDFTLTFDIIDASVITPGTNCAVPIVVGALPYMTTDNTGNYGDDYDSTDEICSGSSYLNGDDVFYAYTPAVNESVDITITNSGTWAGLFVYEGCDPFTTCMGSDVQSGGNPALTGIDLIGGTTYYIVISSWPTPQAIAYDLTIDVAAGPIPGDACDNAIVATMGVNNSPVRPVWYEYTTTGSGFLEVSALGNGVDTRLYVYSDCIGTQVAYNDDFWGYPPGESLVNFAVGAGETYYIHWDGNYSQTPITFTVIETNTASDWTGAVDNDWWNAANWTNGVGGVFTDATIPAGLTNYPTITGWSAAIGNLTIESDASLLDGGFLTVDGTLNVERLIGGMAYHGFSPSVGGEVAGLFHLGGSTGLDVYLYSNNEATYDYTEIIPVVTPLNPFEGYMVWLDGSDWTFTETGTLNTGAFGAADNIYSSTGDLTRGWNFLGNPYTSALDWQSAYAASGVNVDATVYVNNPAVGQWATWNSLGGGLNGGSQYIAMGQGFFVHATAAGVGTLNVDNTDRVHNNAPFLKSEISNKVVLQVAGNGFTDETAIMFNDAATVEFDSEFDAYKLMSEHPGVPSLFSMTTANYAANVLPETNWVQLGFSVTVNGEYTISANEVNDIGNVVLEDTFTGEMTDLNVGSYTFTASIADDANRFIVHFTPLGLGDNMSEVTNIYSFNKTIYINVPESIDGNAVVYDMMGKEVANSTISSTFNTITLEKSGYYVVKVLSNESVVTEKVFIK